MPAAKPPEFRRRAVELARSGQHPIAQIALVAGAGLWEYASHPARRKQVARFNLATAATVGLGVLALYGALLLLAIVIAPVLIPQELLEIRVGHRAGVGDYLKLAW